MGKSTVRDSVATSTPWFTGIFRPDGVLLKKVSLDPTAISFGAEKALAGLDSEDTINEALKFFPSRNGRIYAALETSEVLPSFGHEARLVEVAPSGEVRFYKLHGAKKSELFRVVVGVGRVFAVFGDRDGFKDDLREFQINESSGTLDLVGRYKVLGGPECVSDDGLLVIRPDGKGGKYLVTYKR